MKTTSNKNKILLAGVLSFCFFSIQLSNSQTSGTTNNTFTVNSNDNGAYGEVKLLSGGNYTDWHLRSIFGDLVFSSDNNPEYDVRMKIKSDGNVGIGETNPTHKLHVAGPMFSEKYVVQNGQNGGSSRGIFMWKKNNTDWGMYMASAGTGKSLNGGTAVAGHNFDSHAIRFRVKGDSDRGFIWENSSNQRLMSLNGSSGDMKLKGTLDVGGLTVNGEAIGGTSNNPIDDVLKYQASPDMIIANRDTKFTEDVIVDGDLTLTGPSFNWEANGGTPGVQFAKSDDKLSFNLKWTSKSNYRSYLNITNEYKKSDFPQHIQDIGVDIKANILAPGLMVKDFVMIGAQTQFTKIDNAVLQVDGRVYISETGGSEHGIGDTASINYQDYLLWVEEGVVSVDFALAELADWPDYVFEENYPLQSLNDVEMFIKKNGHLPTMPTAEDVKQNGFSVGKMTINVVKTIEELTLHTIAQEKQIATLMDRLVRLEQMLETKGK